MHMDSISYDWKNVGGLLVGLVFAFLFAGWSGIFLVITGFAGGTALIRLTARDGKGLWAPRSEEQSLIGAACFTLVLLDMLFSFTFALMIAVAFAVIYVIRRMAAPAAPRTGE